MKTITKIEQLKKNLKRVRKEGKRVGFVPTMGNLHAGHLSLIRQAKRDTDFVVVSVFLNPTQFGPGEDYCDYPRNLGRDKRLTEKAGVDLLFAPSISEIYPAQFSTYVDVEGLSNILCGGSRGGHFRAVATVVTKLFNIVGPHVAYFGHKDFQQATIIRKMVKDLNMEAKIKVLPTVREKDGLAISSRNASLSDQERMDALCLYRSLQQARKMVKSNITDPRRIKSKIKELISTKKTVKIDYIAVLNPESLEEVKRVTRSVAILLAVWVGKTRLIDNIIVTKD